MRLLLQNSALLLMFLLGCYATPAQQTLTSAEKKVFSDLEDGAKQYVDLREKVRKQLPKLSDDATAKQIADNRIALQKGVQAARSTAKAGDVFVPTAADLTRQIIKREFKGWERNELRKSVLEADTKGVPLKVNFAYPETKELVAMSPMLLLSLPQLPKQLRYRFIGSSLVIMDRDNGLIIDFMRNALP